MIYKLPEGPRSPPVSFPNPLREIHDCNEEQFQSKNFLHCIRQNKPLSAMVIWENLISPQSGSNLVLLTLSCPDLCSVPQVHRSRSRGNIGTHQKIKVKVIKQTRHRICSDERNPTKMAHYNMKEKSRDKLVLEVCYKQSSSYRLQTERAVKIFLTKELQVLSKPNLFLVNWLLTEV